MTNIEKLSANSIKTEWDLSLYYTGDTDPNIEADIRAIEQSYNTFAKKWRTKNFTSDPKVLAAALTEKEKMSGNPTFSRPMRYYHLRTALNSSDMAALKQQALIERRLREVGNKVLFFTLELGKVDKKTQALLLNAPELKHFRYYLERLFLGAKHHLTEAEEKIISLKSSQSYGRWTDMTDRIISERQITWKGKKVNLPHAFEMMEEASFTDKPKLWAVINVELKQISEVA
jgi:oligoendopeptidase F